ncbi:preQ(1) synthase [Laceyella tengchongensis]|uniref:preQ(1) synthase n=1 Tax=Laceyella tengchongensis TaxID=574699 RepID=UPI003D6D6F77
MVTKVTYTKDRNLYPIQNQSRLTFYRRQSILKSINNQNSDTNYFVKITYPIFFGIPSITEPSKFYSIFINYVPDKKLIEKESLKQYLLSYQSYVDVHQNCIDIILKDLVNTYNPRYMEISFSSYHQKRFSVNPYVNYGKPETRWEQFAELRLTHLESFLSN